MWKKIFRGVKKAVKWAWKNRTTIAAIAGAIASLF
jgi:hypothetical protein